jgi:hypothetical protein
MECIDCFCCSNSLLSNKYPSQSKNLISHTTQLGEKLKLAIYIQIDKLQLHETRNITYHKKYEVRYTSVNEF